MFLTDKPQELNKLLSFFRPSNEAEGTTVDFCCFRHRPCLIDRSFPLHVDAVHGIVTWVGRKGVGGGGGGFQYLSTLDSSGRLELLLRTAAAADRTNGRR